MGFLGELVSKGKSAHPTFASLSERYTEATRTALDFARQQAASRGESEFTVADLLAALSSAEDTRAERIGALKSNAFYLRWLVGLPALPALESNASNLQSVSSVEPDSEARRALAYAVLEADRDRDYWIDSDHLLRGLMRFPNKADFALLKTELSLDSARVGSRKDREAFLPDQNPNLKVVKYLVRKYVTLLVPPLLSLACYLYILVQEFGIVFAPVAH